MWSRWPQKPRRPMRASPGAGRTSPLPMSPRPSLPKGGPRQNGRAFSGRSWPAPRGSDIRSGFTSVGPHRDDLDITLSGFPPGCTAPRGSSAVQVLALKLAEAGRAVGCFHGETPIVLLDDVMSELDQSRQDYLLNHLQGRQVFNPPAAALKR